MTNTTLREQTPVEIDTTLANLYRAGQQTDAKIASAISKLRSALGQRPKSTWKGRREIKTWTVSVADTLTQALAKGDEAVVQLAGYHTFAALMDTYTTANAEREEIRYAVAQIDEEYVRRPWSRFFLVTSSDGHIHSSMNCSTCRITTEFNWLPELSGKTEAEAMVTLSRAQHILCTVCFPSAPVEWTTRQQPTAEEAAADGKCLNREATNARHGRRGSYGDCGVCGETGIAMTSAGLRKHTHRAKARAAELADPKRIHTPEGGELWVGGDHVKTVREAEMAYTEELYWAAKGNPVNRAEHEAKALVLATALAHKAGETVEQVVERLAARVARKVRQG